MEPSNTKNLPTRAGGGMRGQGDGRNAAATHIYAQINKEIALLMPDDEQIVFGPAEDFEYTAPLEDFRRSQQSAKAG